jgi:23S rRNA-/tRNA-specific pseudouridylate synthase
VTAADNAKINRDEVASIGFPPGDLCAGALRAAILFNCEDFLVIDKPAGASCGDIISSLRKRVRSDQLALIGIADPIGIYGLDSEVSGVLLLAKTRSAATKLRNAYGSQLFTFRFDFIAAGNHGLECALAENCEGKHSEVENFAKKEFTCNLPIAQHLAADKMLISHKTGKKSRTQFQFIESVGNFSHWMANCSYIRRHQVRLHASDCGLRIVGEKIYSPPPQFDIWRFFLKNKKEFSPKNKKNSTEHWSDDYLPLHLSYLKIAQFAEISSAPPKKFAALMKICRRLSSN